jgi:putative membrane protein
MMRSTLLVTTAAVLTGAFSLSSGAQTTPQQPTTPPAVTAPAPRSTAPADTMRSDRRADATTQEVVDAGQLEAGANSFTEGQARSRMEDAGFVNVRDLRKDDRGFWRGRAMRAGSETDIAMDFRGRIAAGAGVASLPATGTTSEVTRTGTAPATTSSSRVPDGAPGNPPSTVTGRAVDRMQGETPRPDGTPGNPPGTAVGRAVDRATGSNTTGANTPAPPATSGPTR